ALGEAELDRVGGGGELGRLGAGGRLGVEDAGAVDVHPEAVAASTGRGLGHHVEGDDAPAVEVVGVLPGEERHPGEHGTGQLHHLVHLPGGDPAAVGRHRAPPDPGVSGAPAPLDVADVGQLVDEDLVAG